MKRKLLNIMFLLTIGICPLSIFAQSKLTVTQKVEYYYENNVWPQNNHNPTIKFTIQDAYKEAGKIEELEIKLEGAYWADGNGTNLELTDLNHVTLNDIALKGKDENTIELNLHIPSDIVQGQELSFCFSPAVRPAADWIHLTMEPKKISELIQPQKILIATKPDKKFTYEIGDMPKLVSKGSIAPIILEEVNPCSLGGNTTEFKLTLQNQGYKFGEFNYASKQEYADTIDYVLNKNDYVFFEEGFEGVDGKITLKTYKASPGEVTFRVTAKPSNEKGKIVLKNIPIMSISNAIKEEDVSAKIDGFDVVEPNKNIIIAHMQEKTEEQKEKEAQIKLDEEEKMAEEQLKANERALGIHFIVGKNYYTIDGEKHEMEAAPYIQNPGYVMLPVRYVATALDCNEKDITFTRGSLFVAYNNRKVELRVGSNIAYINHSVSYQMQTPLIIKDERAYVPLGELAKLLGISIKWDSELKEVIF